MFPEQRRKKILELLESRGNLQARELTQLLDISEDTIRRDFKKLEANGQLERVHGGVLPRSRVPLSHSARLSRTFESKQSIARKAAEMIASDYVIALDGGTTALEIAKFISPDFYGTIVTNNLPAAIALADHPKAEVIVLGGKLFKPALDTVGLTLAKAVLQMHFDYCFVGAASVDPEVGFGSLDYEEVQAKNFLIKASDKVVSVVSSEKLGTSSPFIYASPSEVSHLITDINAAKGILRKLEKANIEILIAE